MEALSSKCVDACRFAVLLSLEMFKDLGMQDIIAFSSQSPVINWIYPNNAFCRVKTWGMSRLCHTRGVHVLLRFLCSDSRKLIRYGQHIVLTPPRPLYPCEFSSA